MNKQTNRFLLILMSVMVMFVGLRPTQAYRGDDSLGYMARAAQRESNRLKDMAQSYWKNSRGIYRDAVDDIKRLEDRADRFEESVQRHPQAPQASLEYLQRMEQAWFNVQSSVDRLGACPGNFLDSMDRMGCLMETLDDYYRDLSGSYYAGRGRASLVQQARVINNMAFELNLAARDELERGPSNATMAAGRRSLKELKDEAGDFFQTVLDDPYDRDRLLDALHEVREQWRDANPLVDVFSPCVTQLFDELGDRLERFARQARALPEGRAARHGEDRPQGHAEEHRDNHDQGEHEGSHFQGNNHGNNATPRVRQPEPTPTPRPTPRANDERRPDDSRPAAGQASDQSNGLRERQPAPKKGDSSKGSKPKQDVRKDDKPKENKPKETPKAEPRKEEQRKDDKPKAEQKKEEPRKEDQRKDDKRK